MTVCVWRATATNELQPAATAGEDYSVAWAEASAAWADAQLPIPYALYQTGCRDANGDPHRIVGPTPNAMKPGACPICLKPRRVQVFSGSQP